MNVSIGRIVHYRKSNDDPAHLPEIMAALVTSVVGMSVSLRVFYSDGDFKVWAFHSTKDGGEPGKWHWPAFVKKVVTIPSDGTPYASLPAGANFMAALPTQPASPEPINATPTQPAPAEEGEEQSNQ